MDHRNFRRKTAWAVLEKAERPVVELPTLPNAIDQGGLFELATLLRDDLVERA